MCFAFFVRGVNAHVLNIEGQPSPLSSPKSTSLLPIMRPIWYLCLRKCWLNMSLTHWNGGVLGTYENTRWWAQWFYRVEDLSPHKQSLAEDGLWPAESTQSSQQLSLILACHQVTYRMTLTGSSWYDLPAVGLSQLLHNRPRAIILADPSRFA